MRALVLSVAAFATFLVAGNLVILGASLWARQEAPEPVLALQAVGKGRIVDSRVWRGAAPDTAGYRELAAAGVRTIIDLRAESGIDVSEHELAALGLDLVRMPIRDGQTPTPAQVDTFLQAVSASDGLTFVHCGAGVGRTGAMVAAYRVASGEATGVEAARRNLSVGPPSLEQIVFAMSLEPGEREQPNPVVVAVSRALDAPRRLWHVMGL